MVASRSQVRDNVATEHPNAHDAVHGPSLMKWWLLEQLSQKDLQNPRIRKLAFVKIGFYDDPDWVDR
jgi:hypothetical protein